MCLMSECRHRHRHSTGGVCARSVYMCSSGGPASTSVVCVCVCVCVHERSMGECSVSLTVGFLSIAGAVLFFGTFAAPTKTKRIMVRCCPPPCCRDTHMCTHTCTHLCTHMQNTHVHTYTEAKACFLGGVLAPTIVRVCIHLRVCMRVCVRGCSCMEVCVYVCGNGGCRVTGNRGLCVGMSPIV